MGDTFPTANALPRGGDAREGGQGSEVNGASMACRDITAARL
ncbi:hypothetical protein [Erythrobacter ani]|nr:hypothetical protein [Erythrobacter ani]